MTTSVNNEATSHPKRISQKLFYARQKVRPGSHDVNNRPSKRSYYKRLILSHLLVFAISLVFVLYIGNVSLTNVRDLVQTSIRMQTTYLLGDLDHRINEIRYLTDSFTANQTIIDVLYSDHRYNNVSAHDVLRTRSNLLIYNRPYLTDIALYLPGSKRLISNRNTSLAKEIYLQTYYPNAYDTSIIRNGIDSTRYMSFGGLDTPSRLVIFVSVPRSFSGRSMATAMFVIDSSIFQNIIRFTDEHGAAFTLYSDTGKVLISHGPEPGDSDFVVEETSASGLRASFRLPSNYFADQTRSLQLQLSILLIITTALGALVSWLLSRWIYRPVGNLMLLALDNNITPTSHRTDEIEFIRHGLVINKTRDDLEKDASDAQFLHQLIIGRYQLRESEHERIHDAYIPILKSNGVLIRIDLVKTFHENLADLLEPEPVNLLHTIVTNILDELFGERYTCLYNQDRPGEFVVLAVPNTGSSQNAAHETTGSITSMSIESMREDTKRALNEFQSFTRSKLSLRFHVAYTMLTLVSKGAPDANTDLDRALLQARIEEDKSIFTPEDVPPEPIPYNYAHDIAETVCRTSIQENNPIHTGVFSRIYMQAFNGLRPQGKQLHHFKLDIMNLAISLSQYYEAENDLHYILQEATILTQIEHAFTMLLEDLRRHYLETHDDNSQSRQVAELCRKVDQFIRDHYSEPSLGLHSFEEPFNLTSSYLSSLYKSNRGYSINDRISEVRIEEGKRLLLTTDMNISEIAEACGYLYSTVFIRSFKRQEHTTPGAYRRLHQTED